MSVRETQLEYAAEYLARIAARDAARAPKALTADEAMDARERRYGVRVGLIPPEMRQDHG